MIWNYILDHFDFYGAKAFLIGVIVGVAFTVIGIVAGVDLQQAQLDHWAEHARVHPIPVESHR